MSGSNPTGDEVLRAAKDAGLLFEQEVASALEVLEPSWTVITNRGFEDPDLRDKSREIDVWCHRSVDINVSKTYFSASLLVECKHSTTPFVFMTRPRQAFDAVRQPALHFPLHSYRVQTGPNTSVEKSALARFDELRGLHWAATAESKGVYFGRVVRKGSGWEIVSEGMTNSIVIPLVKAMLNFQGKARSFSSVIKPATPASLEFQFMVVVMDAPMYAIDGTVADPEPLEVQHVRYARELSTKSIPSETYSIDFVHRDHLPAFIGEKVNPFVAGVASFFDRHPEALRNPEVRGL